MKKFIPFSLLILVILISCTKNPDVPIIPDPSNYKTFIFESTDTTTSTLINKVEIHLDNNGQLATITTSANSATSTTYQYIQTFFYSEQLLPDSSVIEDIDATGTSELYTEYYFYNEDGKIKTMLRPVLLQSFFMGIDTIDFFYDNQNRINLIKEKILSPEGLVTTTKEFNYNDQGNILKSVTTSTGSNFFTGYTNEFELFDNKINPLYQLYKKCNFPIFNPQYSLSPMEYAFMKNNPMRMKLEMIPMDEIEQSFQYNQFDYPVKITSNWSKYNVNIVYKY